MGKNGFSDPITKKNPRKDVHSYWQDKMPEYDSRTSCYVNCGTDYGLGHKTPVGHKEAPKQTVETLPQHVMVKSLKPNSTIIEAE